MMRQSFEALRWASFKIRSGRDGNVQAERLNPTNPAASGASNPRSDPLDRAGHPAVRSDLPCRASSKLIGRSQRGCRLTSHGAVCRRVNSSRPLEGCAGLTGNPRLKSHSRGHGGFQHTVAGGGWLPISSTLEIDGADSTPDRVSLDGTGTRRADFAYPAPGLTEAFMLRPVT